MVGRQKGADVLVHCSATAGSCASSFRRCVFASDAKTHRRKDDAQHTAVAEQCTKTSAHVCRQSDLFRFHFYATALLIRYELNSEELILIKLGLTNSTVGREWDRWRRQKGDAVLVCSAMTETYTAGRTTHNSQPLPSSAPKLHRSFVFSPTFPVPLYKTTVTVSCK